LILKGGKSLGLKSPMKRNPRTMARPRELLVSLTDISNTPPFFVSRQQR